MKKRIQAIIEFDINYLWHLWNMGNLWDQKPNTYHQLFEHTVSSHDRKILYANRELIAWGNGRIGILTWLLFFYPLQTEKSKEELLQYFMEINNQLQSCTREDVENDEDLAYYENRTAIINILAVLINNVDRFDKEVWLQIIPQMTGIRDKLNNYLQENDLIQKWENHLQTEFPTETLNLLLTIANQYMPSANNISSSRYNYYCETDNFEKFIGFINHELAANIMHSMVSDLSTDPELNIPEITEPNLLWVAAESMFEYQNYLLFNQADIWQGNMFGGGKIRMKEFIDYYKQEIPLGCKYPDLARTIKKAIFAFYKKQ